MESYIGKEEELMPAKPRVMVAVLNLSVLAGLLADH
jgi:hypothetical protein